MTAVYPGSFDPITLGHADIIARAAGLTDRLIVALLNNSAKRPMFSVEERLDMLHEVCGGLGNVEIAVFDGLLVDFAEKSGANVIIRGLRAVTDFEYEFQLALTNRSLCSDIETLFISASTQYLYLSSSIVKEVAAHGGNIAMMVPDVVKKAIEEKYKRK